MQNKASKNRPVTGFRLDAGTLAVFQSRLRERGMAMQPTLESWVKRWIETGEPFPDKVLGEVKDRQDELRSLLLAISRAEADKQR